MEKITVKGTSFVDSYGRERIFHGINIVDKDPFTVGKASLKDFDKDFSLIESFADRGFNLIRLGTTWSAVEPQPGQYNTQLIAFIRRVLDECEKKNIYAFIDMHQDLFSCDINNVGDGAPSWASLTDGIKPIKPKFVWAEPYFWGRACHRAFDNFWTNKSYKGKGLLEYYADMWKHLAGSLGDHPALFGFDLLNEPYPGQDGGKIFRQLIMSVAKVTLTDSRINKMTLIPNLLSSKKRISAINQYDGESLKAIGKASEKLLIKFDTERYMPFINRTAAAIRQSTDNGVIFVDNCYYSNLGIRCSNVPIMVGGRREEKQCFSPHGYDFMVDTPMYKHASNSRIKAIFDEHKATQARMRVPVIVGEWGGNAEGDEWLPHVEFITKMFDDNKWSDTYWAYYNGFLDNPVLRVLCRPYPKAVTGEIKDYYYDRKNDVFTLSYEQSDDFDAPTVIFVHKQFEKIEADGEYTVTPVGDKGFDIALKTGKGAHSVIITF